MPGAGFKRTANRWRKTFFDLANKPYELVKMRMKQGDYEKSYLSDLLSIDEEDGSAIDDDLARWTSLSLLAAASDTVSTQNFAPTMAFLD